ncbi:MAG TPA: biotin-dependent carboxyltransferase family protein [Bryobacteraceae bacterium]|nr:biotin-dependent carboxyltransferase family protein [Bryobacteraceae bacterium]
MPLIHIEKPGLFTTVQDLGRPGGGPLGISASGAADPIALRLGNRLVGNPEGAAALEMTLLGGTFGFPDGAVIALAGSDFETEIPLWNPIRIPPGATLRVGPTRSGARCYLAVRGGIAVELFLGSASTHVLSGLGGHEGRALRKGDVLRIGDSTVGPVRQGGPPPSALAPRKVLRVTNGPQADWFPEASRTIFYNSGYRVTEEANRMGLRLGGAALTVRSGGHMITEGVPLGAIQVPAGGQPIILFVEQQTTGGYPKIANVIAADVASVGQLRPRDEVRFERVDLATARRLLQQQEDLIREAY